MTVGAVLATIAGDVGEGLSARLWAGIRVLAARPLRHGLNPHAADSGSGFAQLTALEQALADQQAAACAEWPRYAAKRQQGSMVRGCLGR
jgi:hypothetical protein